MCTSLEFFHSKTNGRIQNYYSFKFEGEWMLGFEIRGAKCYNSRGVFVIRPCKTIFDTFEHVICLKQLLQFEIKGTKIVKNNVLLGVKRLIMEFYILPNFINFRIPKSIRCRKPKVFGDTFCI